MPISEDYSAYLEDLFILAEDHQKLNSWEKKFLNDTKERYEQYGQTMFMSDKQKAILSKIDEKVSN